jgi:hypothetical protein
VCLPLAAGMFLLWILAVASAEGEVLVQDLIFVVATVAFFALSIAYVHFCYRLK